MPESVPDGPQSLPRYLRNHLGREFHAIRLKHALLHRVSSYPSYSAVPVVDLHTELHPATPRQERYTQSVREAHCTFLHLSGKSVAGDEVVFIMGEGNIDRIQI